MHVFGEGGENQLAHMQPGGCLYEDSLAHNEQTDDEGALSIMAHTGESTDAWPSAADAGGSESLLHAEDTLDASMTPDNVLRDTTPDDPGADATEGIASNAENLRVWRHLLERHGLRDDGECTIGADANVNVGSSVGAGTNVSANVSA